MLCYGMLWYDITNEILWDGIPWYEIPMLWYGTPMLCFGIPMICYEISIICFAMVHVEKDMLGLTVPWITKSIFQSKWDIMLPWVQVGWHLREMYT